jgi:hypothetical protein
MQNIINCGKLKIIYEQQKKKKKEIAKSCEQYVMYVNFTHFHSSLIT